MRHFAICYKSGIKRGKSDIPSVKYLEIFMGNALGGGHFPYLRNGRPWYCDKGNIGIPNYGYLRYTAVCFWGAGTRPISTRTVCYIIITGLQRRIALATSRDVRTMESRLQRLTTV